LGFLLAPVCAAGSPFGLGMETLGVLDPEVRAAGPVGTTLAGAEGTLDPLPVSVVACLESLGPFRLAGAVGAAAEVAKFESLRPLPRAEGVGADGVDGAAGPAGANSEAFRSEGPFVLCGGGVFPKLEVCPWILVR
jgi:hypothetical protein